MISQWPPRVMAFLLWMLAALSAGYWLMKTIGLAETPVAAGTIVEQAPAANSADMLRVLGPATRADPGAVAVATLPRDAGAKMLLLGVVAGRRNSGIALISLEGQPARPFRVGATIGDAYRLARVTTRTAVLAPAAQGAASITLELPDVATTDRALPLPAPVRPAFSIGQSPFPVPVLPTPALSRPLSPAPAGPLPPANPVDASRD